MNCIGSDCCEARNVFRRKFHVALMPLRSSRLVVDFRSSILPPDCSFPHLLFVSHHYYAGLLLLWLRSLLFIVRTSLKNYIGLCGANMDVAWLISLISPQALVRLSWFLLHSIGHQILHKDTPCEFQNYVVYWRRKQQFTFDKTPVGWMLCKKLAKTFLPNNLPFTSCMGKDITAYVRPANSMEPPQKFYLSAFFGFITLLKWPYLSFYQQWEAVNSIFGTSISKLLERALNQKCFALGVMVLPSFMFLQPYNSNWHGRQCCRSLFAFLVHRFC